MPPRWKADLAQRGRNSRGRLVKKTVRLVKQTVRLVKNTVRLVKKTEAGQKDCGAGQKDGTAGQKRRDGSSQRLWSKKSTRLGKKTAMLVIGLECLRLVKPGAMGGGGPGAMGGGGPGAVGGGGLRRRGADHGRSGPGMFKAGRLVKPGAMGGAGLCLGVEGGGSWAEGASSLISAALPPAPCRHSSEMPV